MREDCEEKENDQEEFIRFKHMLVCELNGKGIKNLQQQKKWVLETSLQMRLQPEVQEIS